MIHSLLGAQIHQEFQYLGNLIMNRLTNHQKLEVHKHVMKLNPSGDNYKQLMDVELTIESYKQFYRD